MGFFLSIESMVAVTVACFFFLLSFTLASFFFFSLPLYAGSHEINAEPVSRKRKRKRKQFENASPSSVFFSSLSLSLFFVAAES